MVKCDCGREFEKQQHYEMHKPHCKGRRYCQNPKCGKLLTEPEQIKFCSSSCSAQVTLIGRKQSIETRRKISKTQGGNKKDFFKKKCLNCHIEITSPKFCSIRCMHKFHYKEKVNDWLSNPQKYTMPSYFMKKWLIEQKGEQCHRCGWKVVNIHTDKIPLELHHKDGIWQNNKPENLDLVCPNCHSLTKTYRIGNRGNERKIQREYYRANPQRKISQ